MVGSLLCGEGLGGEFRRMRGGITDRGLDLFVEAAFYKSFRRLVPRLFQERNYVVSDGCSLGFGSPRRRRETRG